MIASTKQSNTNASAAAARRWWPAIVIGVAIAVAYQRQLFTNLIYARGDIFLYFYPYWTVAAEALRAGRLPLWNPDIFMGAPFLANSQVGLFYPPNWPLWLWLPVPRAVTASIVLHVTLAATGAYRLARRRLHVSAAAATVAALLYALGGTVSAQVEHVNQVQGLAWLPWIVWAGWPAAADATNTQRLRRATAVAALFALQLLTGHTQTTFITGVGLGLIHLAMTDNWRTTARGLLWLGGSAAFALLLTAIQLAPTLELSGLSRRQGGLPVNEAVSFSLHPLLVPAALLPGYGQAPYIEYVAYLPLTALVLAAVGAWAWRRERRARPALLLVLAGLFLALGLFNPLYHRVLARLPGFNLFRVPARWLILYTLGMALLSALGWQRLVERRRAPWRPQLLGALAGLALALLAFAAVPLGRFVPLPPESPAEMPSALSSAGRAAELAFIALLLAWPAARAWPGRAPLLAGAIVLVLLGSGQALVGDSLTAPAAVADIRPAVARLQAATDAAERAGRPPPRFLSASQGLFDPGDQAETDTIYADRLSETARRRLLVTTKDREIVVPNLSLIYGLSAVDGFDGGLLPTGAYVRTAQLLLPDNVQTIDGRLRELLTTLPDPRWLDLFGVRYLITDKTGDQWASADDIAVFFDRQHATKLAPGASLTIGEIPVFDATQLWVLGTDSATPGTVLATANGAATPLSLLGVDGPVARFALPPDAGAITQLTLTAGASGWPIDGAALVDARDGTFRALAPGAYRLVHSGDVKIYENLDVLPRAFLIKGVVTTVADASEAIAMMAAPGFDPARQAVVEGDSGLSGASAGAASAGGAAEIVAYAPERIAIRADAAGPALLLLTEANYPGWEVTVNGEPAVPLTVDGMFRGVIVPGGPSEVVWQFAPASLRRGALVSAVAWAVWAAAIAGTTRFRRKS